MATTQSLAEHVKRRNGVPLGAPGSLYNMLKRSLGAKSFAAFWQYWNPIWGYYLNLKVFMPAKKWLPASLALLLTFGVSGALHDVAVTVVKWQPIFFFTPWFLLMGILVLLTKMINFEMVHWPWIVRAMCNAGLIIGSLLIVLWLEKLFL